MVKHIIFDCDGVLVDSEMPIRSACIKVLGLDADANADFFKPFVGAGDTAFIRGVAEHHGMVYSDQMKVDVYKIYADIIGDEITVYPGVPELLKALKERGYSVAVASAADRVKVLMNLNCIGVDEAFFDALVTGDDVRNHKPAPDCYIAAVERLGADPGECLVVEDAINGLRAAHGAGVRAVGVATTFAQEVLKEEGEADYTIAETQDLLALLAEING